MYHFTFILPKEY